MNEQLNERLAQIKDKQRKEQKWNHRIEQLQVDLKDHEEKARELEVLLKQEVKDVEQLQKMTLHNLFHTILGHKDSIRQDFNPAKALRMPYPNNPHQQILQYTAIPA